MPTDADYTIADLARLTGLSVRTIRYWLAQGLLPASGEAGPGAHYGEGHLDRLRVIKRLQAEYLPNAEIRRRLAPLTDAEVRTLVAEPTPAADPSRPTTSALEYVRRILGSDSPVPPPAPTESMPTAAYRIAESMRPPRLAQPPRRPAGAAASITAADAPAPTIEPGSPPSTERDAGSPPPPPASIATRLLSRARYAPMGIVSEAPRPDTGAVPADAEADPQADAQAEAPAADAPAAPAPAGTPAAPSASIQSPQPERSQWERLLLADNIELHIRRPLSRPEQRRVERLITIARQVLNEGGEG